MADAEQEAIEMLAVYRARLAYSEKVQNRYDELMAEFDAEVARIEKKRAIIQREFDKAPDIIAEYREKVRQQKRILDHIRKRTTIVGQRASGKPIRSQAPIQRLMNLRKQMARLEKEIYEEEHPEEAKPVEHESSRWSKVRQIEGVQFMRDRRSGDWYYAEASGGRVYGPFSRFPEARENASV